MRTAHELALTGRDASPASNPGTHLHVERHPQGSVLSRRQFLHGSATIGVGTVIGGVAIMGCAAPAAISASPFLATLASGLAAGLGMTWGDEIGAATTDLVGDAANYLLQRFDHEPIATVWASATNWQDVSAVRGMVAGNFSAGDESESWTVYDNLDEYFQVPSVVALAIAELSKRVLNSRLPDVPPGERNDKNSDEKVTRVIRRLRREMVIVEAERIEGSLADLTQASTHRLVMADDQNIEVEWDPTTSRTEQSRLTVRRGRVIKGRDAIWNEQENFDLGIPSHRLWATASVVDA